MQSLVMLMSISNEIRCDYKTAGAILAPALSLADAKNYLKIDPGQITDDDLIIQLIKAAENTFEAFTHQTLIEKSFDVKCNGFPRTRLRFDTFDGCSFNCISVRKAPLLELLEIRFFNDDVFEVWPDTEYLVNSDSDVGYPFITAVNEWPRPDCHPRPVEISITVGFSSEASGIPEAIRTGLEQHLASMYENRGDCKCEKGSVSGSRFSMDSLPTVSRLLYSPFVIYAIANGSLC